jgi:adenylate kinase family enzyme
MKSTANLQQNIVQGHTSGFRLWLFLFLVLVLVVVSHGQTARPLLILLGPPASGKSTQAASIQKRYGFALITREQLMKDDPSVLAQTKQPGIQAIEPRVDPALNNLFLKRLEKTDISKGLLLDGYPATKDHGDFMLKVGREKGLKKPIILKLELSDDAVRQRLKGQNSAQIEQDLKDYHRETDFMSIYFPDAEFVKIDASKKENEVFQQISNAIDAYLKKP